MEVRVAPNLKMDYLKKVLVKQGGTLASFG